MTGKEYRGKIKTGEGSTLRRVRVGEGSRSRRGRGPSRGSRQRRGPGRGGVQKGKRSKQERDKIDLIVSYYNKLQ